MNKQGDTREWFLSIFRTFEEEVELGGLRILIHTQIYQQWGYIPSDPSTFSEGDWRHCYVGLEGPVVPSEKVLGSLGYYF